MRLHFWPIALIAVFLFPVPAQGETLADFLIARMPAEHRPMARTLAICVLAEAGGNRLDHAGILYVLQRRAEQLTQRSGTLVSTDEVARRYCRIFRDPPRHRTFLRSFSWAATPAREVYAEPWRKAQLSVVIFLLGLGVDPCDGRAMHWGSAEDAQRPPKRAVKVFCGPTRNIFWSGPRRGVRI